MTYFCKSKQCILVCAIICTAVTSGPILIPAWSNICDLYWTGVTFTLFSDKKRATIDRYGVTCGYPRWLPLCENSFHLNLSMRYGAINQDA